MGTKPGEGASVTGTLAALVTFVGTVSAAACVEFPNAAGHIQFLAAVVIAAIGLLGAFKAAKTASIAKANGQVEAARLSSGQEAGKEQGA